MATFYAYTNDDIIADLKKSAAGADIYTDQVTLKKHLNDPNGVDTATGNPLAYIEVHNVDEIKQVLAVARKYHIPIVPQDTATSTVSGSDAIAGGFILSTRLMNQILDVSREDQVAVVQPGVINQVLDTAARQVGMFYAPDPGSKKISSIGGNVSTNAGGMSTVKYGATKDSVLGLKVVLADGREISIGHRTFKQAFGYDLTQLFVGSEGTLGIITEITVKLFPIPIGTSIMGLAFFDSMTTLAKAVTEIRVSGVYPTELEALDNPTVRAIDAYDHTNFAKGENGAMLILKLDTGGQEAIAAVERILNRFNAQHIQVTDDDQKKAEITKLRQDMLPAIFTGRGHVMEDMAVPLSKLSELMDFVKQVGEKYHLTIFTAGHAGDGNVHPSIVWPENEPAPKEVPMALQEMFHKTLELGGTISGEHAVGVLKNQWNNAELGETVDMIQHQIKDLFDPMNLLNPKRKID